MYEPLARAEVLYAGQPVALVVAESEATAEDAAELVEVELEPLQPVLDLEAATRPAYARARVVARDSGEGSDLADAHAAVSAGGIEDEEELSENVLGTAKLAMEAGAGHLAVLCDVVVKKNRITSVTLSVLERPPRCQCRNGGRESGPRTCVS